MPETYYDRLGVDPDATAAEIRAAYREALKETHPDVSDDPDAADRTRELVAARDVLTDERERARYDRLGHRAYVDGRDTDVEADESGHDVGDEPGNADPPGEPVGTTGSGGGASVDERATRHARNRATRAAWNASGRADAGGGGAGDGRGRSSEARRIYREDTSRLGNRLFPPGESLVLLSAAFVLYPVMLWAALEPAFPLVVNLAVGVCLVLVVGFLLSMPSVAVLVFGAWSLLLPVALVLAAGVDLLSLVGAIAVAGTAVPLFLSLLTFAALRA